MEKKLLNNATKEQMVSLDKNGILVLIEKPNNQKLVGCKWIFTLKPKISGIEDKHYNARVVT